MNADERNGLFTTFRACPPEKVDFCDQTDRVTVAQFRRDGGQTQDIYHRDYPDARC